MLTALCIFISFVALYYVGFPAAIFLLQGSDNKKRITPWTLAPFLGLALIILVLQNLVYLNIPISRSFPWLWVGATIGWVLLVLKNGLPRHAKNHVARNDGGWRLLLIAVLVYCLHSFGLFLVGAKHYMGEAWFDEINYVYMAQALTDYPLNQAIEYQPYALKAMHLIEERIGQSIWHAFLLSSTFTDAKTTFEPAILIVPPLIVLAIYQLARYYDLTEKSSLWAAAIAGCLPGIAMLHLHSFFSQTLAIPLLLLWPLLMMEAVTRLQWRPILLAILIFAAGWSIYSEFFLIFIGVAGVVVGVQLLKKPHQWILLVVLCAIILLGIAFNMGAVPGLLKMANFQRLAEPTILLNLYPWAQYPMAAFETLWLGEWLVGFENNIHYVWIFLSFIFLLLAYFGLTLKVMERLDPFRCAILALALLPFVIYALGGSVHHYQFYKLLLSVSPLLVLGLVMIGQSYSLFFIVFIIILGFSTARMVYRSIEGKGRVPVMYLPAMQKMQPKLESLSNEDILITGRRTPSDPFARYINGWFVYFSRHNRVRVLNPRIGDRQINALIPSPYPLPQTFLILAIPQLFWNSTAKWLWEIGPWNMWRVSGDNWILIDKNGDPRRRGLEWRTLAGRPGILTVSAKLNARWGLKERIQFSICTGLLLKGPSQCKEYTAQLPVEMSFEIPVTAGLSQFQILDSGIPMRVTHVKITGFQ